MKAKFKINQKYPKIGVDVIGIYLKGNDACKVRVMIWDGREWYDNDFNLMKMPDMWMPAKNIRAITNSRLREMKVEKGLIKNRLRNLAREKKQNK